MMNEKGNTMLIAKLNLKRFWYYSDHIFKTIMLKSSLCDYSDVNILVKGNITVNNTAVEAADANNTNKKVKSEINNTEIDNAKILNSNASV